MRVGGIEHGHARMAAGHQRKLVVDVALLAAVPVQMLGKNVQHDRHVRPRAAARDLAGLVAGQLHRPVLRRRLRVQDFQQRQADVAGQPGAVPGRAQQVRQQRGGGALALGAGHAHRAGQRAVGARVLAEPQRGAADELRALRRCLLRLGPVGTDARRFHHHVETRQGGAGRVGFHLQRTAGFGTRAFGFGLGAEQRQRQARQAPAQRVEGGAALAAPAP